MKRWIRWQGLGAFLGVVIIVFIFWFLFIDGFIERMIEKFGTKAVGAKVELAGADLALFPAGLTLNGLQITNPDDPMKNAVEISAVNLSLDTLNLLRRKVIIDEMTLNGVQLDTKRKTSGAVVGRTGILPTAPKKAAKKGLCGEIALPAFEVPDVKEILNKEGLQSIKLVQSLQADIQSEKEQWQDQLSDLPDKKKFDEYRQRIEQLKSGKKGSLGGLLGAGSDAVNLQKEIQGDIDRIKQARQKFDDKKASLKTRLGQAAKAPLKDVERLKKKYGLSQQGLANMSRLVLGYKLCGWTQKAIEWYEKLKPAMERAKKEKEEGPVAVKPIRGSGVNVRFKEYAPLPDFLIRRMRANVQLEIGDLEGKAANITPDQDVLGIPLTFEFSGDKMERLHFVKIEGALDHIAPSHSKDTINVHIKGYEAHNVALSDKPKWPLTLKNAFADLKLSAILKGDRIKADLDAGLRSASFSAGSQEKDNLLAKAIVSALSNVSEFTAKAVLTGTLDEYDIELTSDLDRVLKDAAGEILKEQTLTFEKELKEAVLAKTEGPMVKAKGGLSGFDDIGGELESRLKLGSSLLGSIGRGKATKGLKLPL